MKPETTPDLYKQIRFILQEARQSAYRAVNFAMVVAYWEIGKRIVEHEQGGKAKASYGEGLLKELSQKLTADFGKGFTVSNLENFRKFYLTFSEEKSYALRRKSESGQKSYALRSQFKNENQKVTHCVTDQARRR